MLVFYSYVFFVMSPSPLSYIHANGHKFLNGLSQHLVIKKTNNRNERAKMHVKLLCWMDRWRTKLKGRTKHAKLWHKKRMEYDGMNKGVANQDGKHQWYLIMQSMSKLKKEEKMIMLKASTPRKLMTTCVQCMMLSDVLNLLLLHINDHNQNKEHMDATYGMDRPLV